MMENLHIVSGRIDDAPRIATMLGELLSEISLAIHAQPFNFNHGDTTARLQEVLAEQTYTVFLAGDQTGTPRGFISLVESFALYAEGAFGTIPEFYVYPQYRAQGMGLQLLSRAKEFAKAKGWKRLEVTTPPLPQFGRTLAFYQRHGFAVSGGQKLKFLI